MWHDITTLGQHTRLNDVGRGMPSSPLESIHSRTTLGVAFHHIPWTANAAERRRAWHEITALGLHAPSNDVGRGMTSSPLDCSHGRTTSGVAGHHRVWTAHTVGNVGRDMPSLPLDNMHGRMASSVSCHHRLWTAHTIGNVGRHMASPPLDSTHGRTTSGMA